MLLMSIRLLCDAFDASVLFHLKGLIKGLRVKIDLGFINCVKSIICKQGQQTSHMTTKTKITKYVIAVVEKKNAKDFRTASTKIIHICWMSFVPATKL